MAACPESLHQYYLQGFKSSVAGILLDSGDGTLESARARQAFHNGGSKEDGVRITSYQK